MKWRMLWLLGGTEAKGKERKLKSGGCALKYIFIILGPLCYQELQCISRFSQVGWYCPSLRQKIKTQTFFCYLRSCCLKKMHKLTRFNELSLNTERHFDSDFYWNHNRPRLTWPYLGAALHSEVGPYTEGAEIQALQSDDYNIWHTIVAVPWLLRCAVAGLANWKDGCTRHRSLFPAATTAGLGKRKEIDNKGGREITFFKRSRRLQISSDIRDLVSIISPLTCGWH